MRLLLCVLMTMSMGSQLTGQDPPARPAIVGIDHVAFRISDVPAARRFYREILGFAVVTPGAAADALMVRINARQKLLLEPHLEPGNDERLAHIALATSDLDGMQGWLASKNIASTGPEQQPCGKLGLRVRAPDGQVIEFVQETAIVGKVASASSGAISSRLLHAGVIVNDEAAAHALFGEVLGFGEIWRGGRSESRADWVNMRVPDGTDYLEYMLQQTPPDRRQRGVLHHVCLLVPDIQAAWETVRARSAASERDTLQRPQIGRNKKWQLNLYDPDGTRVELMEPATTIP